MGNGRGLSLQFPNENVRRNKLVPSGPWTPEKLLLTSLGTKDTGSIEGVSETVVPPLT